MARLKTGPRRYSKKAVKREAAITIESVREGLSIESLRKVAENLGIDERSLAEAPFEFDEEIVEVVSNPPHGWKERFTSDGSKTVAQSFGERWILESRSAVLSVPSSVLEVERNFVLNTRHPDFLKIRIGSPIEISLDSRLWGG